MDERKLVYRMDLLKRLSAAAIDADPALRELLSRCMGLVMSVPTVEAVPVPWGGIGEVSDGCHTFNELYRHRAMMFSVICSTHPNSAWKARKHQDGTMYSGMFLAGIHTPEGQAAYYFDMDPYWNLFRVPELRFAPELEDLKPEETLRRIRTIAEFYQQAEGDCRFAAGNQNLCLP